MRVLKIISIQTCFLALSLSVLANEAWFGAEWTFTNQSTIDSFAKGDKFDDRLELRDKWIDKIMQKCPNCQTNGSKVILPDGLWFEITKDLWVLEVNAKPMTLAEIRKYKDILQALVWDCASEVGLTPHYRVGGGHIHLDIKGHFKNNHTLFRNFIVDIFNHPELFMGAFSLDYLNAPPFALLGENAIQSFARALDRYDRGEMSFNLWLSAILKSYRLSEDFGTTRIGDIKFHVLNFDHSETLEIRGFRPQVSAEHFLLLAEILSSRIKILESHDGYVPFNPKNYFEKVATVSFGGMELYRTQVDPQLVVKTLTSYLHSAGVDPLSYATYVTEELKNKIDVSTEELMAEELRAYSQQALCLNYLVN